DGNGVALTNASQVSHVQVASVTLIGIEMSGTNAWVERSTIDSLGSAGILIAGGLPGHPAVGRDNVLANTFVAGTQTENLGTSVTPQIDWTYAYANNNFVAPGPVSPWRADEAPCPNLLPVWCAED